MTLYQICYYLLGTQQSDASSLQQSTAGKQFIVVCYKLPSFIVEGVCVCAHVILCTSTVLYTLLDQLHGKGVIDSIV